MENYWKENENSADQDKSLQPYSLLIVNIKKTTSNNFVQRSSVCSGFNNVYENFNINPFDTLYNTDCLFFQSKHGHVTLIQGLHC